MPGLVKNTTYMTMASVGQKLISFVYFALVARTIGADALGQYTTALAFTTIMVVFVDLGLTNVLVRECAKQRDRIQDFLAGVLGLKLGLAVLSYGALILLVFLLGYESQLRLLIILSGITMLLDSLHLSLYGVLRALGDLRYESLAMFGSQLLTLLLGGAALVTGQPLYTLILAFTIPSAANVCYALSVLRKKFHLRPRIMLHWKKMRPIVLLAIPFALAAIFGRVYAFIDTLFIQRLLGNVAAGEYSIAHKIHTAFQFLPLALIAGLYPRFSQAFVSDKKALSQLFERSMLFLVVLAAPIAVGIGVLAGPIISLMFGAQYLGTTSVLQLLMASLIFMFLAFPIGACLNACNKQHQQTAIIGVAMLANIGMNLWLIPQIGSLGAAASALAANAIMVFCGYLVVPQIMHVRHGRLLGRLLIVLLCAGLMGWAVHVSIPWIPFAASIVLGIVLYPTLLLLLRAVTLAHVREFYALLRPGGRPGA